MTAIALEHVTKRFANGVTAVNDLSLIVNEGELVVLVGPSGCGKTTILRLIAGLEEPSSGTIHLGGRVANRLPPRERNVAMVFQRPALYPHLTVRGNLDFGLRLQRSARWWRRLWPGAWAELARQRQEQKERVESVARLLRLEDVLDRLPAQLSGGQQQRAALGRALVREPAVFLFDEPLSNLDGPLRAEMRRQLHLLHGQIPATMIYVTHDPVEAMALADRLVVLRAGVLQQADQPLVLYDRPANRFVAGFLGWPPMNFLDGELSHRAGQVGFAIGKRFLLLPGRYPQQGLVTLGIRPEAVGLTAGPTTASIRMRPVLVEPLGGSLLATFQCDDWEVTALLPRTGTDAGLKKEDHEVFFDMRRIHLFSRETGVALPREG